jgi:hypothetical protein
LDIAKRGAAGNTPGLAWRIGSIAIIANIPVEPFGQFKTGTERTGSAVYHFPNIVNQLHIFDILGNIIEPVKKIQRIMQRGYGGNTQAGSDSKPGLLTDRYRDAISDVLQ